MTWINNELELHASELVKWTRCEKQRYDKTFNPDPTKEYREHIATWIGSAVHAMIALEEVPRRPDDVVFDKKTPNWKAATWQLMVMVERVQKSLNNIKAADIRHEVYLGKHNITGLPLNMYLTGTLDLTFNVQSSLHSDRPAILDIKTSESFIPAWIQLGAYKYLYEMTSEHPCNLLGVLHCPRPEYGVLDNNKVSDIVWSSEPETCKREALRIARRVAKLVEGSLLPLPAPGGYCAYCTVESCAVRQNLTSLNTNFYT